MAGPELQDLRCEYASEPLGIGTPLPRLSWKLGHSTRDQRQTAYRVIAAHAPAKAHDGSSELVWDSGIVRDGNSVAVPWGGAPLRSRERVYWRAMAWDAQGAPGPWSGVASFEVALLALGDWVACWVGCPPSWPGRAHYFRKTFDIAWPVAKARLYACGLGYHVFTLNGERLGASVLDPAYTDITKTIMYRTFDISDRVRQGANVLGAAVGNGWHGSPRLLAQIEVTLVDGTLLRWFSSPPGNDPGAAWTVGPGPILGNGIYQGEDYDAREALAGWDEPGHPAPSWPSVFHVSDPGGALVSQMIEPIEVVGERTARSVGEPSAGVYVFDFGQNMAGWARLRVVGEPGRRVTLRFAEVLYDDGTVNQENLRQAACTDTYTCAGQGEETWEPSFTYHGFRYVQVEGYPGTPSTGALVARVVRSSVAEAGEFSCSDELLNRIHRMVQATEASNLHGVPTDCPQRNERMGWLNDLAARGEESLANFGMARFVAKWLGDIHDAQDPASGAITNTAPWSWGPRVADPVSYCYLELAWLLYAHYGDRRTMEAHYAGFKAWLDCLTAMAEDHIVSYSLWGDWAPPIDCTVPGTPRNAFAPPEVVSTGFYCYTARLMARIAGVLGFDEDATRYNALADEVAQAFNDRFWDEGVGGYSTSSQSCNALALWMGLVPEDRRARVVDRLARDVVEAHETHLTTGNVGTKYLLEALSDNGRGEVALALARQTTCPSWGYMLANGATTLWERWEHYTGGGMNSHNHPMMGSVGSWFYKELAGLRITPETQGFDRFELRPMLPRDLDSLHLAHHTVRGAVGLDWRRDAGRISMDVEVPVNSRALLCLLVTNGGEVREGGVVVWDGSSAVPGVPGISDQAQEGAVVSMTLGSGRYAFEFVA